MRKGTIKRPVGAKEPIIRIVGEPDVHMVANAGETMEMPDLRTGWQDILEDMFSERQEYLKSRSGGKQ